MAYPTILQPFFIGRKAIEIAVPDPVALAAAYGNRDRDAASLYWAKVWPSAIGLCTFLQGALSYIKDKDVLELAAGPGLPGIFSAEYAKHVCISDIEPEAVELIQQSIIHHQLKNVECAVMDWNDLSTIRLPETVLLSDINYEPAQFEQLLLAIHYLLAKQCTVILSTPQRLMAKDFITQLLPFCKEQTEIEVENYKMGISVFVLRK